MGRQEQYKYHIFQHAWNANLRLIDINYQINFCCLTCKETPSMIILDGIAMGTTKGLPIQPDNTDFTQSYPIISLEERIYIADSHVRHTLRNFAESGISNLEFTNILSFVQPEFARYLVYCSTLTNALRVIDQELSISSRSNSNIVKMRIDLCYSSYDNTFS